MYALPQEMIGPKDWTEDRMQDARGILQKMGIWEQVAPLLESHDVIGRNARGNND